NCCCSQAGQGQRPHNTHRDPLRRQRLPSLLQLRRSGFTRMNTNAALITGAASGIGLAAAKRLAATGHSLYLVDRSPEIEAIADELAAQAHRVFARVADVSKEEDIVLAAKDAIEKMDGVAILVNCAGISPKGNSGPVPLEEVTVKDWEHCHRIN